jgi:hypothetical protein
VPAVGRGTLGMRATCRGGGTARCRFFGAAPSSSAHASYNTSDALSAPSAGVGVGVAFAAAAAGRAGRLSSRAPPGLLFVPRLAAAARAPRSSKNSASLPVFARRSFARVA